jgi:hypothetical protein
MTVVYTDRLPGIHALDKTVVNRDSRVFIATESIFRLAVGWLSHDEGTSWQDPTVARRSLRTGLVSSLGPRKPLLTQRSHGCCSRTGSLAAPGFQQLAELSPLSPRLRAFPETTINLIRV